MAFEIIVPRLGWSMDEGTFVDWLKSEGELVKAGDSLFVLEGEKAEQEVESFDSGYLYILPTAAAPGETVAVGAVLGYLLADGEEPPAAQSSAASTAPTSSGRSAPHEGGPVDRAAGPAARRRARGSAPASARTVESAESAESAAPVIRDRAVTPRARRAASRAGVDLKTLVGSGRNGRIRERDVLAAANPATQLDGDVSSPSRARLTIAQRMLAGVTETAPVTLTTVADGAQLVALREQGKASHGESAPTYNDMLIKLTAATLRDHTELNRAWSPEGLVQFRHVNIAVAVDSPVGLMAPVIRDVDQLPLAEVAARVREAAERARVGRMQGDELAGGTFTISNLGVYGIDHFTPIINLPQAAILGVGRLCREPVVEGDQIAIGWRLYLSLTFDHRAIDGAPAARWLGELCRRIAAPRDWLG